MEVWHWYVWIHLPTLQHLGSWCYIFGDPYIATDDGVVPDGDASEDGAIAIDNDIVLEDGMAVNTLDGVSIRIEGEALGTEGDTLVEFHMVADDAGGSDDHTRTMVYGEVAADGGCWVYVDARLAMSHLGDDTWDEGNPQQVQLVCYAVAHDGAYGGITTDDFAIARGSRVSLVGGYHIGSQQATQVRQAADELTGDVLGFVMGARALLGKAEACFHLVNKLVVESLYIYSRVVYKGGIADAGVAEVSREEDGTAEVHNLC